MRFADHCRQATATFGRPYTHVHRWLDEFAGTREYGMRHRKVRHHEVGIAEVRLRWGERAAQAARQHIEADFGQEGWKPSDPFPKDERDYVRLGFF